MPSTFLVVTTTTATEQQASLLASSILSAGLAACVQIQAIRSAYTWNGVAHYESECLLSIKTASNLYPQLEVHIHANHPYDLPEILAVPVCNGSPEYLAWIERSIRQPA